MPTPDEKEKKLRLMLRQVADVQMQAEKILAGDKLRANVETFARSCSELNDYIRKHEDRKEVIETLDEIPEINYRKFLDYRAYFWVMILLSGIATWWIWVVMASRRNAVLNQIRAAKEKYAALEWQLKGINFNKLIES
jgi:hypothetical protein